MHRWGKWSLILASGFTLFLLVELGILSRYQARVWHDSEALWKYAVAANPNSGTYFNLATLAEAQGKYENAIAAYKQVAAIDPQRWDAHEKAAQLLQKQGNIAEAIGH
jgi:tetratricopeptide (TPR) repeat protein